MRNFAKSTLIAAVLSTLTTSVALADGVGQIKFTGNITAAACLINGGTKLSQTVPMGDVPMNHLENVGYAGKAFSLEFTECSTAPKVTFSNFNVATGVLNLDADSQAKNVGIVLVYRGQPLATNKIDNLVLVNNAVKVDLSAKYKHVGESAIVAGSANAMTQVDVEYK